MSVKNSDKSQPFLQWVGGKRKIADQLIKFLPSTLNNYYEPFLGGGALFFQIRDKFKQCYLSDINLELVTSYNAIKKNPDKVSKLLDSHKEKHSKEHYYQVRSNNDSNDPAKITARFIYLNRYSFKGIYRINIDGKPAQTFSGRNYSKSDIASRLKQCSQLLADTSICAMDFSFIEPQQDDFVYFDPPYHKSGEKFYTRLPFDENEQTRLKDFATELNDKNVKIMVSNSNTPFIRNLYKNFNISTIKVKYSMPEHNKISDEVVITNYQLPQ
ncbi:MULTISPECIES: DNA adenine methylase [Rickettsia]|uniref:Site-specific DNA-methyltransferase (adenine-specific) n=6 Tax=Rickettsia TaxID=780 RepID=Q1RJG8_RICBR|nr:MULTISPECIES: Dam family site-specific DNA-(adenine-N6)-methyltransferase [Rickettsia]ABE04496.1 Site-specific DNA adenine methylase [Rickettsia bellii RML369-C]ABV79460.1 Site-specific DNA adenine methylase [Rickettsia bellii OSU 85-389]AFB26347.1 site-specific DNA adenine methylase [Rickettsia philipii str. 364D]AFC73125.1 site-specific DNA adenine methylase [Rickettsia montanensis str. OSU 85-930]ALN41255.1 DNA methyltransferase [Rickettsia rhipicephali]